MRLPILLAATLALVPACVELSTKAWPDRTPEVQGDSAGSDAGTAEAQTLGGDAIGSNPDIGATAPTGKWLQPAQGAVVGLAAPVTFEAEVGSPYLQPSELFLAATTTTGPILGLPALNAKADGRVLFTVSTLPAGPVTVKLLVMDGANPATAVPLSIYVSTPPGTPEVAIAPKNPTSADDLVAQVTKAAADVDLGEVATQTYQYEWLVGEQPTEVKAATVPAKLTEPGQVWTVRVRAFDGVNLGPPGQATVPIGNLAPELAKVAIAPANPTVADTLVCDMPQAATDADGQKLLFQFSWTVNGQPFAPGADKGALQLAILPQPGVLGGAKVKVPLKAGDVVACSVLVTDGIAVVGPVDSAAVKLGAHDGCGVAFFPCGLGATCTPTDTAAVVCTCKTGLAGDGTVCADVDECTTGKNACDPAADCTNTFGGYTCGCPSGYSGDGWKCSDLDECALGTHACSLQADCANVVGGYDCNCKPGYVGDGQTCTDVDACKLELLICDPHATCVNLPGTDTCTCDLGWAATETNGTASCVDLNECATATACVEGAICTNFQGGYDCTCGPGWQGDGKTCTNIDECKQGTFVCAVEATCQDMMGDYLCVCGKGWIGDGKTCDDVDECANGSNQCDPKALCTNKPGGYDCACKEGLAGDGKTCKAEVK